MPYDNPVLPGFHPDPTVCRVGETFYLSTSTFEYFPGLPIYRSRNLADWEPVGHALDRESQLDTREARISGGIFAPTLRHHDGRFYLTSTDTSGGGHFVVTADDPAGEWSDPVYVDAPGIDPDLFWDDGACYFTYFTTDTDRGTEQAEIDLKTGELGEQRTVWTGEQDPHAEAPHIYEREGTYYLVVAEGGTHTGHSVVVARSDDPTGPFEAHPDNPVLTHREDFYHDIRATGHADLVTDADGNWWLVCLGIRPQGGFPGWHHLGRETFLVPVAWADGWPVVEGGTVPKRSSAELPGGDSGRSGGVGGRSGGSGGSGDRPESPVEHTDTEFADGPGPEWYWRRTPDRDRYEFGADGLVLRGGPETLDEKGTTFLARRQTNLDARVRAEVAFDPAPADGDGPGEEAGVALVMDEDHHYDLGIRRGENGREAVVRLRIGDAVDVVGREPVDAETRLGIDAEPERYRFRVDGAEVATARPKYLSTEVAGGFTGVMVGPYATGRSEPAGTPARVERFVYEPVEPSV